MVWKGNLYRTHLPALGVYRLAAQWWAGGFYLLLSALRFLMRVRFASKWEPVVIVALLSANTVNWALRPIGSHYHTGSGDTIQMPPVVWGEGGVFNEEVSGLADSAS